MEENTTFSMEFDVGASESDCFGRLRSSSLMHFIQEAAIGHVLVLGVDREFTLDKLNSVWMVLRTRVRMNRPILYGEHVTLTTWAPPTRGAAFPRETEAFVNGKSVAEISATWVVANIDTGRIVRPKALYDLKSFPTTEAAKFEPVDKIAPIEPLGEPEVHIVRYSDMDMNRHVHNTRYTDFAADHIRLEELGGRWIREMSVSFSAQCVAGEELHIASANDGDRYYVRGTDSEGKLKFEQEFLLAEE